MRADGATLDSRSANDCQCRQTLTAAVSVGPRLLARGGRSKDADNRTSGISATGRGE